MPLLNRLNQKMIIFQNKSNYSW